jgi:hypothetical protein
MRGSPAITKLFSWTYDPKKLFKKKQLTTCLAVLCTYINTLYY